MSSSDLATFNQIKANFRSLYPTLPAHEISAMATEYHMHEKGADEAAIQQRLAKKEASATNKQAQKQFLKENGYVSPVAVQRTVSDKVTQYHDWAKHQKLNGAEDTHQQLVSQAKARYITNPEEFRTVEDIKANPIVVPKKAVVKKTKEVVPIEGFSEKASLLLKKRQEVKPQEPVASTPSANAAAARRRALLTAPQK